MKNVVVCSTCAEYSDYNTDVVKLYRAVVHHPTRIVCYDPGVGTFSFPGAGGGPARGHGLRRRPATERRGLLLLHH